MYTAILEQLGLPKNEAKIYEALLRHGASSVADIAHRAQVHRRNAYDSLRNLEDRHLVTRTYSESESLYVAAHPRALTDILASERSELEQLLPDLVDIYSEHKPADQISITRGSEGIRAYWNYVMQQSDTTIYFFAGKGAWHDPAIDSLRDQCFRYCEQHNVAIRGIFDYEMVDIAKDVYTKYSPGTVRFLPSEFSSHGTFDICNDVILQFPLPTEKKIENNTLFTITNKPLADAYTTWFNFMWEHCLTVEQVNNK